jgi:hypothetical protein
MSIRISIKPQCIAYSIKGKKALAISNSVNSVADRVKCKFAEVGEEGAAYEPKKVLEDL